MRRYITSPPESVREADSASQHVTPLALYLPVDWRCIKVFLGVYIEPSSNLIAEVHAEGVVSREGKVNSFVAMRLTLCLLKVSHRHRLRMLWRHRGVIRTASPLIPEYLQRKGSLALTNKLKIEPIDANKYVGSNRPQFEKWEPAVKDDPRFFTPTEKDSPDYHDEPVHHFTSDCQLSEGLEQASILTKSQTFEGMPESVKHYMDFEPLPDQDELVQRSIMQAHIWDPTKVKLPKRHNPDLPMWHFKAEKGIPSAKTRAITIRNMLRLCQFLEPSYSDISRLVKRNHYLSTFYMFQGTQHLAIKGSADALVASKSAVPAFASGDEVKSSADFSLPDIFPLSPLIDLNMQHVYRSENVTGWMDGASHVHPHLLCLDFPTQWTTSQRNACALMMSFGHSLSMAKQMYGWEVSDLPQPISTQCLLTDGHNFTLSFFQLNTLRMDSDDGIKNMAWFDSDNKLFNKIVPKRAMLRNTKYEDYDPQVFKKVAAMYLYGAKKA
ncbi:hypothetical protein CAPTEDRAFT_220488 [Capitella teleta]|uniref:Large ribosomal subunit protein mL37 n=1 Tax=Capitella teleta TaxID=283909 RepID=R7V9K8_CAPTE|nr:hypothetical protein CAPTEDRAFT_220488 [Capitella teleta]|eukprot:ELU12430.1 hypothetical protein CAPTEDRAFT_220488 [Capitella teleta]